MGNKTPQQKKSEPIRHESEFKLTKAKKVYKDYPILSNPNPLENDLQVEEPEGTQEYLNNKEKIAMISKINIQKYCKIDENVEQKKQKNMINLVNVTKKSDLSKEAKKIDIVNEKQHLKIIQDINKDLNDLDMIRNTLCKISFLRDIARDNSFWKDLVREMSYCAVESGKVLIEEKTFGTCLYILKHGSVQVSIGNKPVTELKSPVAFGERALLSDLLRNAGIKSLETCYLYVLERDKFVKLFNQTRKELGVEERKEYLEKNHIFRFLNPEQKDALSKAIIKEYFDDKHYIIKDCELLLCIYLFVEGEAEVKSDDSAAIAKVGPDDIFGLMYLLLGKKKKFSLIATKDCICYRIGVTQLIEIFGEDFLRVFEILLIRAALHKDKYFTNIAQGIDDEVLTSFEVRHYNKGEVVIESKTNASQYLYVILDGDIYDDIEKKKLRSIYGDVLYSENIYNNQDKFIANNLKASPECHLAKIARESLLFLLGGSFNTVIEYLFKYKFCRELPIFKALSDKTLIKICHMLHKDTYTDQLIFKKGDEGSRFYLIQSGKIKLVFNDHFTKYLTRGDYFGERALFFNDLRLATAFAEGVTELYYLEKKDFLRLFIDNATLREHMGNRINLQDLSLKLDDMVVVRHLAYGNYGEVVLGQNKNNNVLYALKIMYKRKLVEENIVKHLKQEKQVLNKIDHPFILKLVKSLKDTNYIIFVLEFINGKNLFETLQEIGFLNYDQARFFIACLLLAIFKLHEHRMLFRDLKPENVMVNNNGFLKIIDFGYAIMMQSDRTKTLVGTPHYMAPEIFFDMSGYSFSVDYWAIGVMLYEFICGRVPFGDNSDNPEDIYNSIMNDDLKFPPQIDNFDYLDLVRKMLQKKVNHRLYRFEDIKEHPFFTNVNFDWESLENMSYKPPYLPPVKQEKKYDVNSGIPLADWLKKSTEDYKKTYPIKDKKHKNINSQWEADF